MRSIVLGLFVVITGLLSAQDMTTLQGEAEKLMNSGDYAGATAKFKEAIVLDSSTSGNSTLYTYAGMAAKESGDIAFAKKVLKEAIKRGKDNYTYTMLEDICKADKDYACQVVVYKTAMESFPEQKGTYTKKLAYAYYNGKMYNQLIPTCKEVIALNGVDNKMTQFIAVGFQKTNQTDSAKVYFEKLLDVDATNLNANIFMGQYYYQLGKDKADKAKKNYEKIAKPDRIQWSNYQKENKAILDKYYPKAASYLENAYAKKKMNSIKSMLFGIYTKLGDTQKAQAYK